MKTIKIIGISFAAVIIFVIIIEVLGFYWRGIFYWPYAAFWMAVLIIHIVSAVALFKDVKDRQTRKLPTFLSLDAVFWAMVGFAFGIVGLLAHWFFNDYLRLSGYLAQQTDDGNSGKPPGDESTP